MLATVEWQGLTRSVVEACTDKFQVVSTEFDGRQILGSGVELDDGPKRVPPKACAGKSRLTDSGTVSQEAYLLGIPTIFVEVSSGTARFRIHLPKKNRHSKYFRIVMITS